MVKRLKRTKAKSSKKSTVAPGIQRKKIIKNLDELVSKICRERGRCEKCGSTKALQTHHAFGRKNMSVRWSLLNLVCLCYPHHLHWAHRDVMGFAAWFENKIGQGNYDYLKRAANAVIKWTPDELERLYKDTKEAYDRSKQGNDTQGNA